MKYQGALIVVEDMQKSRRFYEEILGQKVENDFGSNVRCISSMGKKKM